MEVEAVDEGVLGKILVPDGTAGVKVNDPIAVLVEDGKAAPAAPAAPAPKPVAAAPAPAAPAAPVAPKPAVAANGHASEDRVFASPLARRMAQQAGIDLHTLKGTGPGGRIVRADIEASQKPAIAPEAKEIGAKEIGAKEIGAKETPAAAPPAPAPRTAPPAVISAPHDKLPLNGVKRVTARRLTEAKQTIPHFYVTIDVELDALLKLRGELNAKSPKEGAGAFKLSVNDLLIKACAVTLRRVPRVNASWSDDAIIQYHDVDISVAVSIPDGLITPIIRQADRKGLAAISAESKALIERARAGKLKPEEFQGGSFSISNMGMYGVRAFSAIINPPQAAILAVASAEQRAVVKAGALAVATVMTCTISVDHRVIDGALAAEWLAAFKSIVEDPLSLML
jgi:pyruvate dehydrogenase E2 component (dihydrolipoamide acetyltransferase)